MNSNNERARHVEVPKNFSSKLAPPNWLCNISPNRFLPRIFTPFLTGIEDYIFTDTVWNSNITASYRILADVPILKLYLIPMGSDNCRGSHVLVPQGDVIGLF
jgi:hypothetical protein